MRRSSGAIAILLLLLAGCSAASSDLAEGTATSPDLRLPPYMGLGDVNGDLTVTRSPRLEPFSDIVGMGWRRGALKEPLIEGPTQDGNPVWRPDGSVLVFSRERDDQTDILAVVEGRVVPLTRTPHVSEWPTAWAPDGNRLLFMRGDGADTRKPRDLFILDIAGGTKQRLTSTGTAGLGEWSPTGDLIAYSDKDEVYGYDIFTVRPDGTGTAQLPAAPADEVSPDFSPDGRRIVYARARNSGLSPNELWMMDVDGSHQKRLHAAGKYDVLLSPAWSPDGRWIAFTRDSSRYLEQVYFLRVGDPSSVKRIRSDSWAYGSIDWRPLVRDR